MVLVSAITRSVININPKNLSKSNINLTMIGELFGSSGLSMNNFPVPETNAL